MAFEIILRGGTIIDGTGAAPYRADVGITAGSIAAIGDLAAAQGATELDVDGQAVAPGFIDAHTHTDLTCYREEPLRTASILQGVTTEICGNCGFSAFPFAAGRQEEVRRHVGVLLGPRAYPDLATWASAVEEQGLHSNLVPLVGHGTLRAGVLGLERRPPRDDELDEMAALGRAALEHGAAGLSSGLVYAPGTYAQTSEVTALCTRILHGTGRPYVTHVRGETHMVARAVEEAITIGREAGIPVHISHHKVGGRENWGRSEETLELIAKARAAGIDVTLDVYPYTAASTLLYSLLPPWVQDGGRELLLARLRERAVRRSIQLDIDDGPADWENMPRAAGWDGIVIASAAGRPEYEGRSVAALAEDAATPPLDFVADLLVETNGDVIAVLHLMAEGDVRNIVNFEAAMIGSDGLPLPGKPHPRAAGTFTRMLGRYVREERLLSLADVVRKMSALPAARFGLADRGLIRVGKTADLVVFSPASVSDKATFNEPLLGPSGVDHVLVQGKFAVTTGKLTGAHPGRVLASNSDGP